MSESIRRRNSSRQLLQNLIRVTAQRSQEDAEEVERERRRRARERPGGEGSPPRPEPPQHSSLTHNTESGEELKPSCRLVLDEDEGFSDWSHRLEHRNEQEVQDDRTKEQRTSAPPHPEEEKEQEHEDADGGEPEQSSSDDASTQSPAKTSSTRNAARTSYSSSVFLSQDARLQQSAGRPADRTSYLAAGTMRPRGGACMVDGKVEQEFRGENEEEEEEEIQQTLQGKQESAEIRPNLEEEEDQDEDELSFTDEEKEDHHFRGEQRSGVPREEQRMQNQVPQRSEEGRGRRSEEANTPPGSLCSSSEGEESLNCYGPMSPTFKKLLIQFYPDEVNSRVSADGKCTITERTESLKRSTSNVKKTQLPVSVSKIDKRLEQYTHALEVSSKECRPSCQMLTDLTTSSEPVASKKNLFEAGEAWNQNAVLVTPSKDADGLKVGVADLINQWVKGGEDGSRCSSPSKPAEIKAGGVLNKKNLWESLGDTLSARDGKDGSTKPYKYVVTGHGKYEKVSADGCSDDISCPADGEFYEDL